MNWNKWWAIVIGLVITAIYLNAIWYRPLFPTDEPRYGEIAREMLVSGDWVTPRLAGFRYFEKPVMGHWLNAASLATWGENPFAVRFASTLSALLTAAILWCWGSRAGRERRIGGWSAIIYLTSVLPFAISTWSVLDSMLTLWTTAALATLFFAFAASTGRAKWSWLFAAGLFTGAAFLTKGFPGIVVPGLGAAGFLLWERRWRDLLLDGWLPLAAAAAVVAPWAIAIHRAQPDFWHYFVIVEHWNRFVAPVGDQHPQPFWFFLPVLLAGMIPWVFFLPLWWSKLRQMWREEPLIRFASIATVLVVVFMSASSGKLAPYVLPVFPLLALVFASGLLRYFESGAGIGFTRICRGLALLLGVGVAGFALYQIGCDAGWIPAKAALYASGESAVVLLALAGVLCWVAALHWSTRGRTAAARFGWMAAGTLIVLGCVHFVIPARFSLPLSPEIFYAQFRDRVTPDTRLIAYGEQVAAMCWSFRRSDVDIYEKQEELMYGAGYPDAAGRIISPAEFRILVRDNPHKVVVGMTSDRRRKALPPGDFSVWANELLFQEYEAK